MHLCMTLFFFFPGRLHLSGYDTVPSLEIASLLQCPQTRSLTLTFRSVTTHESSVFFFFTLLLS